MVKNVITIVKLYDFLSYEYHKCSVECKDTSVTERENNEKDSILSSIAFGNRYVLTCVHLLSR